MKLVTTINEWVALRKSLSDASIGLVHTMGHLHDGHMSLIRRSRADNEVTVAAIFVNPTQFNNASDFQYYPRTLDGDKEKLEAEGVDYCLLFSADELYKDQFEVQVSETMLSKTLEGEFRPGHFTGMLTIVLKFLNIVNPTRSYYGEKDYQQLMLIKKVCGAMFLPVEVVACETLRDVDGLALSSRNTRLSSEQRQQAAHFPRLLMSGLTTQEIIASLIRFGFKVDYVVDQWQRRLAAVWLGDVRLIDNISLEKK